MAMTTPRRRSRAHAFDHPAGDPRRLGLAVEGEHIGAEFGVAPMADSPLGGRRRRLLDAARNASMLSRLSRFSGTISSSVDADAERLLDEGDELQEAGRVDDVLIDERGVVGNFAARPPIMKLSRMNCRTCCLTLRSHLSPLDSQSCRSRTRRLSVRRPPGRHAKPVFLILPVSVFGRLVHELDVLRRHEALEPAEAVPDDVAFAVSVAGPAARRRPSPPGRAGRRARRSPPPRCTPVDARTARSRPPGGSPSRRGS